MTPKVLVGHDASGLELRMLAHYLNVPKYIEVVQGDPHTYHQELLNLDNRDKAKEFIYKFNYGAGALLIGMSVYKIEEIRGKYRERTITLMYNKLIKRANKEGMINIGKSTFVPANRDMAIFALAGEDLKVMFLKNNEGLSDLIDKVQDASSRGYLVGLDGRRITMRRDFSGKIMKHKALNTLMQSAGSVVMKHAMVLLDKSIKEHGLHSIKVIDMHDEAIYECLPEEADLHAKLAVQSVRDAGTLLNLNCPLDAQAQIGKTWAEVH